MEKQVLNKGFTLIEALIVIICISVFSLISVNHMSLTDIEKFVNTEKAVQDVLKSKMESIIYVEKRCVNSHYLISNNEVCFNSKGNINQAQTFNILKSDKTLIIHLGSGVYEIK